MKLLQEHCVFIFVFYSILLLPCVCNSGIGPCPKLSYIQNFDLTNFLGQWYEIERSFYFMELIANCVSVDLSKNNKDQIEVSINMKSRWSGKFSISEGIAVQSKKDPSVFLYRVSSKLPKMLNRYLPGSGFYQIIQTDYTRYAVLYSCTNYQILHTDLVWIWGRSAEIDVQLRAEIYETLEKLHIDTDRLILPRNQNCTGIKNIPWIYDQHIFPNLN